MVRALPVLALAFAVLTALIAAEFTTDDPETGALDGPCETIARSTRRPVRSTGRELLRQKRVREVVVPALLRVMEKKNSGHPDTESAAYIALSKVTRDSAHIATIQSGLDLGRDLHPVVRESAALGLGLLRRASSADQFSARDLDGVREILFQVFEDDRYRARTRGFAAIGIGLLGDQPTGSGARSGDADTAARATTRRLFELLAGSYANSDLVVGLLMAVEMQPYTSVTSWQREVLATAALKGRLYKEGVGDLIRSYAAHALGRIGTRTDIRTLESILSARRGVGRNVQRSAAIGLGLLGRRISGDDRVQVARVLLERIGKVKDRSTKSFGIISLAYLLIEDIEDGRKDVIDGTRADEFLLETAERGSYLHRPFGAMALGLVLREISDKVEIEAFQKFREQALAILCEGVASKRMDKKGRAAFCTAVGIAKSTRTRKVLAEIVGARHGDKTLRSYAALGLGLIGEASREVTKVIADALKERSSEALRRQTAVALGLLGNPMIGGTRKDVLELLLEELEDARTQDHKGQIVLALARVRDDRAIDKLIALLEDDRQQDLTRALACAGLGLICDPEPIPSLARGTQDLNYRASTDLTNELMSIL